MATTFANLGGVADPRLGDEPDYIGDSQDAPTVPAKSDQRRKSLVYTDSSIPFEEYLWWAGKSREYEKSLTTSGSGIQGMVQMLMGKKTTKEVDITGVSPTSDPTQPPALSEKPGHADGESPNEKSSRASDASPQTDQYGISHSEWYNAQRAVRTATWGSVFYLITTDILGPYSVPWAISQMGYGPGAILYIVFGLLAAYSGTQLWRQVSTQQHVTAANRSALTVHLVLRSGLDQISASQLRRSRFQSLR